MTNKFNSKPLISVVVPFYNVETTILQAIQSVFAQTYQHWELVLLDDGSTDDSLRLARSVMDKRVRVLSDGVNKGHAHRRNELLLLANGDFIALLDADDLMHPQRLEKQLAIFMQSPKTDVVVSAIASINASFQVVGVRSMSLLNMTPMAVLTHGEIAHPTLMARSAWFKSHPYREGYHRAEDRELLLRSLPDTHFQKICEPLYFYMESGVQNIDKILASYKTERKTIVEYGFKYVGFRRVCQLWLRSWGKVAVVYILSLCGLLELLARRRIMSIDDKQPNNIQVEIDRILKVSLPINQDL